MSGNVTTSGRSASTDTRGADRKLSAKGKLPAGNKPQGKRAAKKAGSNQMDLTAATAAASALVLKGFDTEQQSAKMALVGLSQRIAGVMTLTEAAFENGIPGVASWYAVAIADRQAKGNAFNAMRDFVKGKLGLKPVKVPDADKKAELTDNAKLNIRLEADSRRKKFDDDIYATAVLASVCNITTGLFDDKSGLFTANVNLLCGETEYLTERQFGADKRNQDDIAGITVPLNGTSYHGWGRKPGANEDDGRTFKADITTMVKAALTQDAKLRGMGNYRINRTPNRSTGGTQSQSQPTAPAAPVQMSHKERVAADKATLTDATRIVKEMKTADAVKHPLVAALGDKVAGDKAGQAMILRMFHKMYVDLTSTDPVFKPGTIEFNMLLDIRRMMDHEKHLIEGTPDSVKTSDKTAA